jgi:hypothetical protein
MYGRIFAPVTHCVKGLALDKQVLASLYSLKCFHNHGYGTLIDLPRLLVTNASLAKPLRFTGELDLIKKTTPRQKSQNNGQSAAWNAVLVPPRRKAGAPDLIFPTNVYNASSCLIWSCILWHFTHSALSDFPVPELILLH